MLMRSGRRGAGRVGRGREGAWLFCEVAVGLFRGFVRSLVVVAGIRSSNENVHIEESSLDSKAMTSGVLAATANFGISHVNM